MANQTGTPTASDFQFATWDGIASSGFTNFGIPPTVSITTAGGSNGSKRVKIEFPDNAIRNTWLRVTMLANANTGLAANDVFYFGNAVGDMNVGNTGSPITVQMNQEDVSALRGNLSLGANSAAVSNIYDLNKDGRVNAIDLSLATQSRSTRSIRFFTAPATLRLAIIPTSSVPFITEPTVLAAGLGITSRQDRWLEDCPYDSGTSVFSSALTASSAPRTNAEVLSNISANSGRVSSLTKPSNESSNKELSTNCIQSIDRFFERGEFWK